jgi:seryl-tRNA synthetase
MLDLQFLCDHLDEVRQNLQHRGVKVELDQLLSLRDQRREWIQKGDQLRKESKDISAQIPKASADEKPTLVARGKELRPLISEADEALAQVEAKLKDIQSRIPNMTHPDAPVGSTEDESVVACEWGEKKKFDFKPLDHVELNAKLDIIDFESGSKVAGHGFYFLKNEGAMLELALIQYVVEKLRNEGFTIYSTPDLARDSILEGIGFSPRGNETQIYSVAGTDLSMVATAEITLGGMLANTILDASQLPIKACGISHCFRTEAGAHGKATRGIYRVHQFTKVEMFGFTVGDTAVSDEFHAMILRIEEEIFQGLGIPYRVLDICTADLGGPAYRKFDIEAWMPGRGEAGEYGEVTSCSNCTDYQSRRLNIRSRTTDSKGTQFVHTLNGTAVAVSRALIAVLENNQQADGSVVIPEVLRKWVGTDIIQPRK